MALLGQKKIQKKDIFPLILGGTGVLTMLNIWTFNINEIFAIQNLYFLAASISWSSVTIISSKSTKTSPIVFTFYVYLIIVFLVSIFFVNFRHINYEHFDYIFWINLFTISIISTTFATTIYFIGIQKLGANKVTTFVFLVPFFDILFSVLFLKEHITFSVIIGTIMTLYAVKTLNNIKLLRK